MAPRSLTGSIGCLLDRCAELGERGEQEELGEWSMGYVIGYSALGCLQKIQVKM